VIFLPSSQSVYHFPCSLTGINRPIALVMCIHLAWETLKQIVADMWELVPAFVSIYYRFFLIQITSVVPLIFLSGCMSKVQPDYCVILLNYIPSDRWFMHVCFPMFYVASNMVCLRMFSSCFYALWHQSQGDTISVTPSWKGPSCISWCCFQ